MVHTYRVDRREQRARILAVTLFYGFGAVLLGAGLVNAFRDRVVWGVAWAAVLGAIVRAVYRRWGWCCEIRLSDEGTCELKTTWRQVIRLHVNQINAVQYAEDEGTEHYTLKHDGGSVDIGYIKDLDDFLAQLKALSPAVDLSSCPGWPEDAATARGRADLDLSNILFPLFIISMIAAIAWLTFR
jgi:hypothetical protein